MRAIVLAFACAAVAIAGCAHKPYEISDKDRHRFSAGLIRVERPGKAPLIEGLDSCIVYEAQYDGDRIGSWKAALGADWAGSYPAFLTACSDETIAYRNGEVRVYLCAQAIGAGGGCANGGYYRSRTGERPWLQSGNQKSWWVLPP